MTIPFSMIPHEEFPWIGAIPPSDESRTLAQLWYKLPSGWAFQWIEQSECAGCPNVWNGTDGHKCVGRTWYDSASGAAEPTTISAYYDGGARAVEYYYDCAKILSWLYFVAVGQVGWNTLVRGHESINPVEQYTVQVSVESGSVLTLVKDGANDYPWRLGDVEGDNYASISPGMMVYNPANGLTRKIKSVDYGGLESGSNYNVTLYDGGVGAESGEYVQILAYHRNPEKWAYIQPSARAYCEKYVLELTREELIDGIEESGDFEDWYELPGKGGSGSCRIAFPIDNTSPWADTFKVEYRKIGGGYVNMTTDFIDGDGPDTDRLDATHGTEEGTFKTYIQIDPDADLSEVTYEGVRITYWPETGSVTYGTQVSEMHCLYDRRDWSNSIGTASFKGGCGVDASNRHWYCAKMRTAGVLTDNYNPGLCYQWSCPEFELSEPGFVSWEDIARLYGDSGGIALHQLIPGVTYWWALRFRRGGYVPSVGYLAGMPIYTSAGLYINQCLWAGAAQWGYTGSEWINWWWRENWTGVIAHESPTLRLKGPYPTSTGLNKVPQLGGAQPRDYTQAAGNAEWYYDDESDVYDVERAHGAKRLTSSAVGFGGVPDSSMVDPHGEGVAGEARYQRVSLRTATFRTLDTEESDPQYFEHGNATLGSWTIGGVDYGLRLQLTAPGGDWAALTQVGTPTIYDATVSGAAGQEVLCLTFLPGHVAFGFPIVQDVGVSYCLAGGNVVEAPPHHRPTNPLCSRNKFGGMLDRVVAGCTITINGLAGLNTQKLTVIKARSHSSTAYAGSGVAISSHQVTSIVPGFWTPGMGTDIESEDYGEDEGLTIDSVTYAFDSESFTGPAGNGEPIESVEFLEVRTETDGADPGAFFEDGGASPRFIVTPAAWKTQDAIDDGADEYTLGVSYHFDGESPDAHGETFECMPLAQGTTVQFACCPSIRLAFAPSVAAGSRPTFMRYISESAKQTYVMTLEGDPVSGLDYWTDPLTLPSSLTQYKVLSYDGAWFILFHPHHAGTLFQIDYTLASPVTIDTSAPNATAPGIPDYYEGYRLKMDQVWLDVSDDTESVQAIITAAGAGTLDNLTINAGYSSVLKPKMHWYETGFETALTRGWADPVVSYGTRLAAALTIDPEHYLLDRAMGLIYIRDDYMVAPIWTSDPPCIAVDAWWFDRTNHLDAEQLLGMRATVGALTTFRSMGFAQIPFGINATAALHINPGETRTWYHPDFSVNWPSGPFPVYAHLAWPAAFDVSPSNWVANVTEWLPCDGCVSDGRWDGVIGCEAGVGDNVLDGLCLYPTQQATEWDNSPTWTPYSGAYEVGARSLSYEIPPILGIMFICNQCLVPMTAPGALYRISPSRIAGAWVKVQLSEPSYWRETYDTMQDPFVWDTEEIEDGVNLSVAAYIMHNNGGTLTFTSLAGGESFSVTGDEQVDANCTTLMKSICAALPSLTSNDSLVLTVTAANAEIGDMTDIASVASQYVEELSIRVDDYTAGSSETGNGHPGNVRVRIVTNTIRHTGISFSDLRIKLSVPSDLPYPNTTPAGDAMIGLLPGLEDA